MSSKLAKNKTITKTNTIKKSYNNNVISETFDSIMTGAVGIAIFALIVIFPLYTHDMYFDILSARYLFFKVLVVILFIFTLAANIIHICIETDENTTNKDGGFLSRIITGMRIENLHKHILVTDVFFLLMIIACAAGTFFSSHQEESFFGTSGRYQGLECWLLYFVFYIIVSRNFNYKKFYLNFAIAAGVFASIWGITDYFKMNIFGFLDGVAGGQVDMFMSSVGNLNTYTNYTTMIFAVSAALFMVEKNKIIAILYYLASIITCAGSIYGLSDNVAIAFAAFYIAAPFLLLKDKKSVVRYLLLSAVLFLCMSIRYWVSRLGLPTIWGSSILFELSEIAFIRNLTWVFLLSAVIVYFVFTKGTIILNSETKTVLDEDAPKFIKKAWTIFVLLAFALIIFIFVDVNVTHNFTNIWSKIPSYHQLVFSDDWGTHRGHNWRIAYENFVKFNPIKKLFGFGPDTYLVVSERSHYREMVDRYGEVYDSAHNEYIQYLICEGLVGLISYLGIFVSAVAYGKKMIKENREYAAIALAVICYLVQAVVNIAIPITTPILFSFAFMLVSIYYRNRKIMIGDENRIQNTI